MEACAKREEILRVIRDSVRTRGYPPTVREICAQVGLRSPSTVHAHLQALEQRGDITRTAGKTRALALAEPERGIPILGQVAAGQPILAEEDILGYLPLDPGQDGEYFALRIRGDSMQNAGILTGDLAVVRRQSTARSGEIVVALLGEEATCKRLRRENGQVLLLPENEAYQPLDGTHAVILGKVTAVVRTYP